MERRRADRQPEAWKQQVDVGPWNQPQAVREGSELGDCDEDLKDFCLRAQRQVQNQPGTGVRGHCGTEPGLSLELGPRFNPGAERVLSRVGRESVNVLVTQSRLTLCDPMDCSLPGSSVHGIFQARVLEWVTVSFYRGSSQPRD